MQSNIEPPTVDADGEESHPAWGVIGAFRVSGGPGVLFDSDIRHQHHVVVRIERAVRKRDLNQDWIRPKSHSPTIVEVAMSEAQWASFVSAMNQGNGVPCTIDRTEVDGATPAFPYEPRLRESMQEVRAASRKAFEAVAEAQRAVDEAFARKAGRKEMGGLLAHLRIVTENAPKNMAFAASSLTEHAENVVQRARADVEAMVQQRAAYLGLEDPSDVTGLLPSGDET